MPGLFLFVSHVSEDRSAAMEIVSELERRGVRCWIAPRDVRAGKPFDDEIADAIDASMAMLLIFSERCNESEYIRREVTVAGESQKVIIPFRIENAQPRRGLRVRLSDLHWIDGFVSRERAIDDLVRSVQPTKDGVSPDLAADVSSKQPVVHLADRAGVDELRRPEGEAHSKAEAVPPGARLAKSIAVEVGLLGTGEVRSFVLGAGKTEWFKDFDNGPEMVVVPAGSFNMGSPNAELEHRAGEGPQHQVTFLKPFAVGRFAVTFDEWDAFERETKFGGKAVRFLVHGFLGEAYDQGWGRGRRPVINVCWHDVQAYVTWLTKKTGKAYRLPSEAEWEYAARAGTTTRYWWGDSISPTQANYFVDGGVHWTQTVDAFEPNPWGLYQVHGNVDEWVQDFGNESYHGAPTDGSAWTTGKSDFRVTRGGGWASRANAVRSAVRVQWSGRDRRPFHGFRVVRTLAAL